MTTSSCSSRAVASRSVTGSMYSGVMLSYIAQLHHAFEPHPHPVALRTYSSVVPSFRTSIATPARS